MNLVEETERACKEHTLLGALSWICVWESERAIKQAHKNLTDNTPANESGAMWETCFEVCLKSVMDNYKFIKEENNMLIKEYTTEQLKQELQNREGINYVPNMLANPDYTSLKSIAESYLSDELKGVEVSTNWAYECIMETYYGDNFFDWVNELPHRK